MRMFRQADYADVERVGIPRALLYYRYGPLWTTFFRELDREVVFSRETDKALLAEGEALSVDECCLASKAYLGHAASLIGSCDALFVPCIDNMGHHLKFCTKFQALPDLVANTLRDRDVRVMSCQSDLIVERTGMREAFRELGLRMGASPRKAKHAWRAAYRAQEHAIRAAAEAQEKTLASLSHQQNPNRPLAILLVAHSYIGHDPYLSGGIVDMLTRMGATVLHADEFDRERARRASFDFSATLPWVVNRELIGALTMLHSRIDGIVLMNAFPCGPDSMTDDAIMRCIQGKPILNLTTDAQSGRAGLETRVESFVDILRYQKRGGYVHA